MGHRLGEQKQALSCVPGQHISSHFMRKPPATQCRGRLAATSECLGSWGTSSQDRFKSIGQGWLRQGCYGLG